MIGTGKLNIMNAAAKAIAVATTTMRKRSRFSFCCFKALFGLRNVKGYVFVTFSFCTIDAKIQYITKQPSYAGEFDTENSGRSLL